MEFTDILQRLADNQTISALILLAAIVVAHTVASRFVRNQLADDSGGRRRIISNINTALAAGQETKKLEDQPA